MHQASDTYKRPPSVLLTITHNIEDTIDTKLIKYLPVGNYDESFLKDVRMTAKSSIPLTMYVFPGTSVKFFKKNGSTKIFVNESDVGDQDSYILLVNTQDVKSFVVSGKREHFTINSYGISIMWIDILIILLVGILLYYLINLSTSQVG